MCFALLKGSVVLSVCGIGAGFFRVGGVPVAPRGGPAVGPTGASGGMYYFAVVQTIPDVPSDGVGGRDRRAKLGLGVGL